MLQLKHGVTSREQWFTRQFATCWSGTEPYAKSRSNTLEDLRSPHAELVAPAVTCHLRARITRGQRAAISAAYETHLCLERWRYITEAGLWCRGDLTRSFSVIVIQRYSVPCHVHWYLLHLAETR